MRADLRLRKQVAFVCQPEVLAEGIGTFMLVFAGTGAVMVDHISNGSVTHLGISFVFGAIVTALIYAFGHISGAHFNPAVTLAFWTSGVFPRQQVLGYVLAQLTGAIAPSRTDDGREGILQLISNTEVSKSLGQNGQTFL